MNRAYKKLTYLKSGVNIKKADGLIAKLQKSYKNNHPNVVSGIGGFASLYTINLKKYAQPTIVCGTDGVGTKLKIAKLLNQHNYIGQDLVAMCVNDIITCGADPLFFLDYFATGRLDIKFHANVLKGIKKACSSIDIPLIGGETAEMPGIYKEKDYEGIIDSVASRIDAQTRSILARAKINNKSLEIIPGSLLDIKLIYNEKEALSIADTSIIFEDKKKFIYKVLDNNKIDKIEIITAIRKDGNLEVLDGLQKNDRIVKEGLSRLNKGMTVKPINK